MAANPPTHGKSGACNGVFDFSRRTQASTPSGASNVISMGYGAVRWKKVYMPRR